MFTKYLSKISAIAIAGVVAFPFTACSKSTASLDPFRWALRYLSRIKEKAL